MVSNGRPICEVYEVLGIGENLIYKWNMRSAPAAWSSEPASAAELAAKNYSSKLIFAKRETVN